MRSGLLAEAPRTLWCVTDLPDDARPADQRSILFVHAHPDDESITNGATMAHYAASGAQVTLVTCTRGELGEILVPGLAHLAADREDRLGEHRAGELAAAMRALGVTDHRFLGEPGEYRDSGMAGTPDNERPDSFRQADPDRAAARLAGIIREVRPQVLVTYDEVGGYGHPDHIQTHRVAMRAVRLVEHTPDRIAKVYWHTTPRSAVESGLKALREAGGATGFTVAGSPDDLPFTAQDSTVTAVVSAPRFTAAKAAAMRAHATQIIVAEPFFALSNRIGQELVADEYYRLAEGEPGGDLPERDLFAGLRAAR
jgi:N-acetyl-1-D-myo-inositol-2-amino-2-deoxy-alpha-D-glucopyranoside deacetylase